MSLGPRSADDGLHGSHHRLLSGRHETSDDGDGDAKRRSMTGLEHFQRVSRAAKPLTKAERDWTRDQYENHQPSRLQIGCGASRSTIGQIGTAPGAACLCD